MLDKNDTGRNTTAHERCCNHIRVIDKLGVQAPEQPKHRQEPRRHQTLLADTTNHHCGGDSHADNGGNRDGHANVEGQHGGHANFYCGDVDDRERQ